MHVSRVSETSPGGTQHNRGGVWSGCRPITSIARNGCDIRRYWRGVRYFDGVVEVSQLLS